MFLPLYDKNVATLKLPYVTFFLIAINALVFFVCAMTFRLGEINNLYGFSPSRFLNGENFSLITLITYMFLHVNFWYLILNMWALWLFGNNIEQHLGHIKFLFFYILSGIFFGLLFVLFNTSQEIVIGASGAVSGVIGAYLFLFSKHRIQALWFPLPIFSSIPAVLYISIYFLMNLFLIEFKNPVVDLIYVGGYIIGILLLILVKRKTDNDSYLITSVNM